MALKNEVDIMSPVPMDPISSYSHWFISLSGSFEITGTREVRDHEMYILLCAEAKRRGLNEFEVDTVELLFWAACQNIVIYSSCKEECSAFFGPHAITKELFPPKRFFILTKRESAPMINTDLNLFSEGQWSLCENDWFVRYSFKGTVKKLTALEVSQYSEEKVGMYLKTDKYNPYCAMSSARSCEGKDK
ncbi:TPA_asm: M [Gymnadenia densiflora virus 1]|uniref:M n=1 Tax=Gymnadenia densiflora virus 1 TaxID=3070916 RepID=A0A8D9PGS1_9RHAB|nr:M [Gymnadenia densiflora virus 1] [Gymnadenia densiflora virus 1]DAF42330.1 TPA_asm: M [Gymnadenia densiflora virus 1]